MVPKILFFVPVTGTPPEGSAVFTNRLQIWSSSSGLFKKAPKTVAHRPKQTFPKSYKSGTVIPNFNQLHIKALVLASEECSAKTPL